MLTMETNDLGLLTPETTLERATTLNNAFLRLEPATRTNAKFRDAFAPVFSGWSTYYAKLRGSYFSRLTEYGSLEKWEKEYIKLRDELKAAGAKVAAAPIIVAGKTPGDVSGKVEVAPTPETEEKLDQMTGLLAFLSVAAAAGGLIWFFNRKGGGTAGVGLAGTEEEHSHQLRELIRIANGDMNDAGEDNPSGVNKAYLDQARRYLIVAGQEMYWLPGDTKGRRSLARAFGKLERLERQHLKKKGFFHRSVLP